MSTPKLRPYSEQFRMCKSMGVCTVREDNLFNCGVHNGGCYSTHCHLAQVMKPSFFRIQSAFIAAKIALQRAASGPRIAARIEAREVLREIEKMMKPTTTNQKHND